MPVMMTGQYASYANGETGNNKSNSDPCDEFQVFSLQCCVVFALPVHCISKVFQARSVSFWSLYLKPLFRQLRSYGCEFLLR